MKFATVAVALVAMLTTFAPLASANHGMADDTVAVYYPCKPGLLYLPACVIAPIVSEASHQQKIYRDAVCKSVWGSASSPPCLLP